MVKRFPKKYTPCGARMLCRRVTDVDSDVLIMPREAEHKSFMFEVLAKGPDCIDDLVPVGICFYTGKFAPCFLPWPGQGDLYSVNESDVLGTVGAFGSEPTRLGPSEQSVLVAFEKEEANG
jgi:hypothetical protein